MTVDDVIAFVGHTTASVVAAIAQQPIVAVEEALAATLVLVPRDDLAVHLTAAAERRAQAVKDAADAAKFGTGE